MGVRTMRFGVRGACTGGVHTEEAGDVLLLNAVLGLDLGVPAAFLADLDMGVGTGRRIFARLMERPPLEKLNKPGPNVRIVAVSSVKSSAKSEVAHVEEVRGAVALKLSGEKEEAGFACVLGVEYFGVPKVDLGVFGTLLVDLGVILGCLEGGW